MIWMIWTDGTGTYVHLICNTVMSGLFKAACMMLK
jgi:hypothetical protein